MVNSVSFGRKMEVFDKANLNAPQTYTRPSFAPSAPEKPSSNHKVAKTVAKFVATAAVIAGALVLGHKTGAFDPAKIGKLLGKVKDAKWLSFAKQPVKTALGAMDTAGKYIAEKSVAAKGAVVEYAKKGYEFVKNLLPKKS